ncbi:tRNA guanosine(34) transglycosylase Tgt [Candidatus Uhrbacteria bacterium CG_4_9_14_0_2_um_filter_41_50]|uniref:Queuine tRNA-ribosyltransferase n=1 Tax=Candidatus Uhrbacteria bacterium CG_4_9_14_0_2_um_filter_41_50 TaxID=1975031 RepID=A0A2M8EPZ2_9BACT|nr:MAG: tRNA guanosine(34) transglycosylase Tgt [Candidatus Uhrbacteria bacterium CG_4_10_14_3_um_filter_41_21]PIZ55393.1 MAG: tRNA guanosine(34) transglycosylase Tgt [Candidatus Uhrbacteria bacterium CG_4_10_14_0_2_um_filter_41_21]PJB84392.1 MAG: tRNA guanosine(34) transglycosylase Tgt [Candidatus Uhrbacteria bacterium CG_4_9_14_0_8_um_filter_41_16]PJC24810.1 MAG: tRNA guanosine(34) transglycosylase Tgt [Candidatus Uhrbacteria bacterium CG_4_9_14_0_2_um_filter_41_50]PJE75118.1 MAG: tRNA guanos
MFSLKNTRKTARRGQLELPHGVIETPFFMPIATKGAVKTLSSEDIVALGAQIVLSNTYHLLLRPGADGIKKLGGLHKFMNWQKPILTDSGGYQVFSLSKINKTDDDGVAFQSHIDGKKIKISPEGSMAMQSAIGADIIMQFDDVTAGDSTRERYQDAMERSLKWAQRCKDSYNKNQKLFGIVQGGTHEDLREISAKGLMEIGFDGYAIGGLSVGESRESAFRIAKRVCEILPVNQPRYFMGGGMPEEIVYYVSVGVDMFDCVLPTRNARHGTMFLWKKDPAEAVRDAFELAVDGAADTRIADALYSKIQITNEAFEFDQQSIDEYGPQSSGTYTKAYLRHLFKTDEALGYRLATMQNLGFYLRMMKELRKILT